MFTVLFAINFILLPAVLVVVIYGIISALSKTPEVPETGATRSRSIRH